MYEKFVADFRRFYPNFPTEPSLNLGLAIKQIRLRMGLTQEGLARDAKMKPSALKTLENGYAKFTTISNLEAVARVLRLDLQEILLEAREWFPGNFFVLKLAGAKAGIERKRKPKEETWFKRRPLSYEGFEVDLSSPPLATPSQFSFALLQIAAGKGIYGLKLRHPNQVAGLVERGALKIIYDSKKEMNLFGNQGFSLRGDKAHDFLNLDKENPVRLSLAFSLAPSRRIPEEGKLKSTDAKLAVGRGVKRIRYLYSDSETRPLTFAELSCLTGLEEKSLQYLEKTVESNQVVYWDKIEKITQALRMPFSRFLDLAEGREEWYFYLATAHDRALIDYRHYLGVRIKSALFPSPTNTFHLSEMYVEPRGGIRRVTWKRKDEVRIVAYVEDGELLVEVGKNRKVLLKEGDSVYFDGSLGYIFTNPAAQPAKLLVATSPPLIF